MNKIVSFEILDSSKVKIPSTEYISIHYKNGYGNIVKSVDMEVYKINQISVLLNESDSISFENIYFDEIDLANEMLGITGRKSITFKKCIFTNTVFNLDESNEIAIMIVESGFENTNFINHSFNLQSIIESSFFKDTLKLDYCKINENVLFEGNRFYGHVRSFSCGGEGYLQWVSCDFYHKLEHKLCYDLKNLYLRFSTFHAETSQIIDEASIDYVAIMNCTFNSSLQLFTGDFDKLNISNTIINGNFSVFFDGYLDYLSLHGVTVSGYLDVDWHNLCESCYLNDVPLEERISTMALLIKNYSSSGEFEYQDNAYHYMRTLMSKKNYTNIKKRNILLRPLLYFLHFLKWILFGLIGRYGTSYTSVLVTMLATIFIFSLGYGVSGMEISQLDFVTDNNALTEAFGYIYYSSITFFTVGYGEVTANSLFSAGLSMIESFIGVFLMSYFVVAFARKLVR